MKIEPTPIAAASLIATDANDDASPEAATVDATVCFEPMRYDDLLPYLFLPMAGAY
ncbi:hypothetical protein [Caballeronia glebae]|jgi:hypothetical protein|uniref:Uncharacterized protein n=1 Tax=Caballeronia glebae TaxID=1777143 RepID=A0A158CSY1_9BURK|nr:hypothetical protein [Caballeronia glebae]SAK85331.1 hypothetical protein AWB82_05770 [Caballeronia glebae]